MRRKKEIAPGLSTIHATQIALLESENLMVKKKGFLSTAENEYCPAKS